MLRKTRLREIDRFVAAPLRSGGTTPCINQRCPIAAAMGTARTVSIVVSVIVVVHGAWILVVGGLTPQEVQQIRDADRARPVTGILEDQQQAGPTRQVPLRGVPQSVVSALMEAARQDVLQEAPQELDAG